MDQSSNIFDNLPSIKENLMNIGLNSNMTCGLTCPSLSTCKYYHLVLYIVAFTDVYSRLD